MRFLKQSTSVDLPIGPFVDSTDGFTAETALTLTQPDIRLKKNAAAWGQKAAAQTLTHEENGNYEVTLDATDTDTLGQLRLHVNETGALPVWEDFMVMPANVYDSLFGADALQVHAVEIAASLITATSIASDAITAAKIADGAIDAATFAAGAINAAAIAADAIGASELAADAITEIQSGLATAAALTTVDDFLDTEVAAILAAVDTEVAAIKAVTDLLPNGGALSNLDAAISTRATPAQVNTEVVDALNVDTYAEPGQEAPPATTTLQKKISYLFKGFRNRFVQNNTAGTALLYADDGTTVDQRGTVADDGVTFDKGELGSGP